MQNADNPEFVNLYLHIPMHIQSTTYSWKHNVRRHPKTGLNQSDSLCDRIAYSLDPIHLPLQRFPLSFTFLPINVY